MPCMIIDKTRLKIRFNQSNVKNKQYKDNPDKFEKNQAITSLH